MDFDLSDFNQSIAKSAASAAQFSRQHERMVDDLNRAARERAAREAKMVAGAEASVAQKELLEQQVEIILKQNELLSDNYAKLKEMFDAQVEANKEAKEELKQSKRFNIAMMIISTIAMLAAVAGPVVTILVSK